jgi:hypothetical protein
MSKEENVLDKYKLMAEIISMDEPTEITNPIKVKNARIELAYEKCKEIAEEYATICFKAQEEKHKEEMEKSNDLWKMLNEINDIMWQSHMIKGVEFGDKEGDKIMAILEQWATKY